MSQGSHAFWCGSYIDKCSKTLLDSKRQKSKKMLRNCYQVQKIQRWSVQASSHATLSRRMWRDETRKHWVFLFTCFVTRSIYKPIENLQTTTFLNCLRRFVARRGSPTEIISDNASQFKLAQRVLKMDWNELKNENCIQQYCSTKKIKCLFITEFAPW